MSSAMNQARLAASYAAAVEVMKERAVSFYGAFRHLPSDRFHAVVADYDFCRAADDVSDEVTEGAAQSAPMAQKTLDRLEHLIRALHQHEGAKTSDMSDWPWAAALADTLRQFDLPLSPFLAQLDGQRRDIRFEGIRTTDDLLDYARLVAGSVGLMLLPLLAKDKQAASDPSLMKACEDLGIGMQITNILRDVGEDLRLRNRVYLPLALLRGAEITLKELRHLAHHQGKEPPRIPERFIRLWERLADIANPCYKGIEGKLCQFHEHSRLPLLAAARSYRAIADAVRQEGYNCFTTRCYTSDAQRAAILQDAAHTISQLSC